VTLGGSAKPVNKIRSAIGYIRYMIRSGTYGSEERRFPSKSAMGIVDPQDYSSSSGRHTMMQFAAKPEKVFRALKRLDREAVA
jgi:hypothetical protein